MMLGLLHVPTAHITWTPETIKGCLVGDLRGVLLEMLKFDGYLPARVTTHQAVLAS